MADDHEVEVGVTSTCDCGECERKVKVHVTFANYGEDGAPPVKGEWLWATPTDVPGHFRLANIPFFADFGYEDVVRCEPVEWDGERIEHEIMGVVKPSGNLTTRLFFMHDVSPQQAHQIMHLVESHEGVGLEWANQRLATVSIPPKWSVPDVLGIWVKSGAARSDLFEYDENGVLHQ